jgi:hypothetical protein
MCSGRLTGYLFPYAVLGKSNCQLRSNPGANLGIAHNPGGTVNECLGCYRPLPYIVVHCYWNAAYGIESSRFCNVDDKSSCLSRTNRER